MLKKLLSLLIIFILTLNFSFATAFDFEGIQDEVYSNLREYNTHFTFDYYGQTENLSEKISELLNNAAAYDDYLQYVINNWHIAYEYSDKKATLTITIDYKTSKEKEMFVRSEVKSILESLNLSGLSDYQRLEKIVQYMNQNYSYDKSLQKFTAYDLITSKQAVCQGYAEMFYLLAQGASIPVRTQEGTIKDSPHLWNLVRIGDLWYHIDITNFHLYQSEPYIVLPNQALLNYQYHWQTLKEPAVDTINFVDVNYLAESKNNTGLLSDLGYKKSTYELSETAKLSQMNFNKSIELLAFLNTELEHLETIQTIDQYNTLSVALENLKRTGFNLEKVTHYTETLAGIYAENSEKMTDLLSELIKTASKSTVKPATESGLLKAIKTLEEGKLLISKQTFDLTLSASLISQCDVQLKVHANELVKLYKDLYLKTKKVTYKDKYLKLAKKYSLKLN